MKWGIWQSLFRRGRTSSFDRRQVRVLAGFEQLESRRVLAASAFFNSSTGALTVSENLAAQSNNNILVSYEISGGQTLVTVTDQGADILPGSVFASSVRSIVVATAGGNDTVSLSFVGSAQFTQLFQTPIVDGGDGNDTILGSKISDLLYGVGGDDVVIGLESADHLYGGEGADRLFGDYGTNNAPFSGADFLYGENGDDLLFGDQGNDTLLGFAGLDQLFANDGDDALFGMDGDDQVNGNAGNDRMVWNPGDDTDLNEGGDGTDTAQVNGDNGAEDFTTTANGVRVRFDRLNPAPFSIDIGTTENLLLNAGGGDDSFSATGNLAALIQITVDGGAGNDTLLGSNGADMLLGGDDNDLIDGQQGNDVAQMGAGNDVFQWDPGDGSDTVEGQAGTDTMLFNGSAANEIFDASANADRVRFTRNLGNIVMDLNDVEALDLNALGGADTITVNNLAGTDITQANLNLEGAPGSGTGDAQPDVVIVNGTAGNDILDVTGAGTSASLLGMSAQVNVTNSEGANDSLVVNALLGDDDVTATTLPAGVIQLTVDGGAGDDTLRGSQGADVFLGGDDDDSVFGDNGNDVAFLGAGDDVFQWDPGDGSDTLEGQAGIDEMLFNGSNANENIDVSANGGRVRFFRDVANITMDLDDVETITFNALGGADNIVVNDLSGTDAATVNVDLAGTPGGNSGDGQADNVTVTGTNGDDVIPVTGSGGTVTVSGLSAVVNITNAEGANDSLTINALGGADVVDANGLQAGVIQLNINGGLGDDVMIGSQGDDQFTGGDGNDVALMGAGNDTFTWNPGDDNDTLEGQDGTDTMLFNGANVAENIDISANGGRILFFRNVANVTMDLDDVESIDFNALGGADTIVVNDLFGTDATQIAIDLAAAGGGGDAQPDNIILNGTNVDDVALPTGDDGSASVLGLYASVQITDAEVANDRVTVNVLGGADVVDASGLSNDAILLTANGGEGDDILIGGDGDDTLNGENGDDVLIGGPGLDALDGGPGDNTVIQ